MFQSVLWEQDGVTYLISGFDTGLDAQTMFDMAAGGKSQQINLTKKASETQFPMLFMLREMVYSTEMM